MLKGVLGSSILDFQICCAPELLKQLLTMLQLVNIVWGFSQERISAVCVDYI